MCEKIEDLKLKVDEIKVYFQQSNIKGFPSRNNIKNIETNLNLIIEQAELLIKRKDIFGFEYKIICQSDLEIIASLYISDLRQFYADNYDELNFRPSQIGWGQTVIPSFNLYHLSRSNLLDKTYKYNEVEINDDRSTYRIFSIPFILRLAIEKMVKSFVGFVSSDVTRAGHGIKKNSKEFPVTLILNELRRIKCLDLPINIDDLINIYSWASNFCHTAEKEPIWLISKALSVLSPMFDYDLWKKNQKGISVYFLKSGFTLAAVEKEINGSKNPSLKPYKFHFDENSMELVSGLYSKTLNKYI